MIEMCHGVQHQSVDCFTVLFISTNENLLPFQNQIDFEETVEF